LSGSYADDYQLWDHLSELRSLTSLAWEPYKRYDMNDAECAHRALLATALRELPALCELHMNGWCCSGRSGRVRPDASDHHDGPQREGRGPNNNNNNNRGASTPMLDGWIALTRNLASLQQLTSLQLRVYLPARGCAWHVDLLASALRQIPALQNILLESTNCQDYEDGMLGGDIAASVSLSETLGAMTQLTSLALTFLAFVCTTSARTAVASASFAR
jgi:hypothetical protein